ncbi:hypothetical protein B0J13DRAFT_110028 [Dactylonectria estremocensis]|uniref:N-acetyltransferase ESCO zinc-finger domain-containing protein n=1 Tax=Dactylonectria estremocensis TaxID=1079267 RepID=A0A9P9FAY4_9HYPO|nr:hypothetical protein B0J13DRAFT_110028 [Dactylonectria estremocensis]
MSNQAWQLIDRPVTKSTMYEFYSGVTSPKPRLTNPRAQAGPGSRSRTRGKPLRTYGKRAAASDARGETALKKKRTSDEESPLESGTPEAVEASAPLTTKASATDGITATTATKTQANVGKGSIMSFFKPVSQPTLSASSTLLDEVEFNSSSSSPLPPSPPQPSRAERRKPRFLKFRGNSLPRIDTEESENDEENGSETDDKKAGGRSNRETRKLRRGDSRSPLRNRHESPRNEGSDVERAKRPKAKPSPTVQTTLNISCQAAFSECKVCNTVWNPLHPDDVKFHKKQHAAVLRAKRKLKENEL